MGKEDARERDEWHPDRLPQRFHQMELRSSLLLLVGLLISIAIMFLINKCDGSYQSAQVEYTSHTAQNLPEMQRRELTKQLAEDRRAFTQTLEATASGDLDSEQLMEFYREHALFSRLVGGGDTFSESIPFRGEDPMRFEVTITTVEERVANGLPAPAFWGYNQERRELYAAPPDRYTEIWYGVKIVHELQHVYDVMGNPERRALGLRHTVRNPHFLEEEVRASTIESRLLNQATGNQWQEVVSSILADRVHSLGRGEWIILRDEEHTRFDELFDPALSDQESRDRHATERISVNFALAERAGRGLAGKMAFLRALYETRPRNTRP